jgi:DNA recombination protein RmuC
MNIENIFLILIIIIILVGGFFIFNFLKNFQKHFEEKLKEEKEDRINEKNSDQSQIMLQNQISKLIETNEKISSSNEQLKSELTEKINEKLNQNQKEMNRSVENQFSESQKLIKNITEELHEVKKTSGEVASFAQGLKNLQDILQNSKQRGALGEYFLESTIKNILPVDSYEFQYLFKDKTMVDAVIKLPEGIVPVDSKFSLENYNNFISESDPERKKEFQKVFREDLKKRVMETSKYIKPREGTMDFAFMFIPSEGIYYDLLTSRIGADVDSSKIGENKSQNFLEYAFREKKVIVVSPTTLHAYLQTVMQGLKALRIEKKAGEIGKKVEDLQKHIIKYSQTHKKVGTAISTAVNQYNISSKSLKQISNDTIKITGSGETIEENLISKIDSND